LTIVVFRSAKETAGRLQTAVIMQLLLKCEDDTTRQPPSRRFYHPFCSRSEQRLWHQPFAISNSSSQTGQTVVKTRLHQAFSPSKWNLALRTGLSGKKLIFPVSSLQEPGLTTIEPDVPDDW
jgi:hypothetical protein